MRTLSRDGNRRKHPTASPSATTTIDLQVSVPCTCKHANMHGRSFDYQTLWLAYSNCLLTLQGWTLCRAPLPYAACLVWCPSLLELEWTAKSMAARVLLTWQSVGSLRPGLGRLWVIASGRGAPSHSAPVSNSHPLSYSAMRSPLPRRPSRTRKTDTVVKDLGPATRLAPDVCAKLNTIGPLGIREAVLLARDKPVKIGRDAKQWSVFSSLPLRPHPNLGAVPMCYTRTMSPQCTAGSSCKDISVSSRCRAD